MGWATFLSIRASIVKSKNVKKRLRKQINSKKGRSKNK